MTSISIRKENTHMYIFFNKKRPVNSDFVDIFGIEQSIVGYNTIIFSFLRKSGGFSSPINLNSDFGNIIKMTIISLCKKNKDTYVLKNEVFEIFDKKLFFNFPNKIYYEKQKYISTNKCTLCKDKNAFCENCGGIVRNPYGPKRPKEYPCKVMDYDYIFSNEDPNNFIIRGKKRTSPKPDAYLIPVSDENYMNINDILSFFEGKEVYISRYLIFKMQKIILE
jgi:hypothetical protein